MSSAKKEQIVVKQQPMKPTPEPKPLQQPMKPTPAPKPQQPQKTPPKK